MAKLNRVGFTPEAGVGLVDFVENSYFTAIAACSTCGEDVCDIMSKVRGIGQFVAELKPATDTPRIDRNPR